MTPPTGEDLAKALQENMSQEVDVAKVASQEQTPPRGRNWGQQQLKQGNASFADTCEDLPMGEHDVRAHSIMRNAMAKCFAAGPPTELNSSTKNNVQQFTCGLLEET